MNTRYVRLLSLGVGAIVLLGLVWLLGPWGDADLSARPDPAGDYESALKRIAAIERQERVPEIAERGRSYALLHGSRVETSVVVFHGYMSSPKAFRTIAQSLYESGYNVWVPRAPAHGYRNYMTDAHAGVTARMLVDYADESVDIAAGLGDHVMAVGQSGGGALTLWTIAERDEVRRAVAITPFMHPREGLPVWQMRPLGRLSSLGLMRGWWRWNDPVLKGSPQRQVIDPNAYPRASVNALMQYLTIGRWLADTPRAPETSSDEVVLVVNRFDPVVDGDYNSSIAKAVFGEDHVEEIVIPESAALGHDLCDPEGENRAAYQQAADYVGRALGVSIQATATAAP